MLKEGFVIKLLKKHNFERYFVHEPFVWRVQNAKIQRTI